METNEENVQNPEPDFLSMGDDEVMGMSPPAHAEPAATEDEEGGEPAAAAEVEVTDPVAGEPAAAEPVVKDPVPVVAVADPLNQAAPAAKATKEKTEPKAEEAKPTEPAPIDYEAGYKKIMAPFKANGREITLQSPEEATKLMQMGANYTKKMQALQPTLRVVKMLENNQLLDEVQLSYLIDLHQKKPEAIQKLLADSNFDPLSADVEKAAGYVPGNHQVSEGEIQFEAVLEDVQSTPTGPELITEVAKQWDADSRQALFKDPRLLAEINNQKASGLYGRISSEIERRRVLGELQGVSFLAAYEHVGKDLQARGLLVPAGEELPRQEPPVTRVVVPAPAVVNSERARAAMPTKVTPASAKEDFNPLAQSDEEFEKYLHTMKGRL